MLDAFNKGTQVREQVSGDGVIAVRSDSDKDDEGEKKHRKRAIGKDCVVFRSNPGKL
jgi:hypothetical protein